MQNIDFSPLTRSISSAERLKIKNSLVALSGIILSVIMLLIGFSSVPFKFIPSILFFLIPIGIIVMVVSVKLYVKTDGRKRFNEFAALNGAAYETEKPFDGRPGIIFEIGDTKKFPDVVTFTDSQIKEIGIYEAVTGSGRSKQELYYCFVRFKLPRRLPNMILDSKQNNSFGGRLSNLPQGISSKHKLSLEGNFDSRYSLYVPEQYQRDALYIFTPDVMHALLDSSRSYDCEVVDDDFYIFLQVTIRPAKFDMFQEMINIANKVGREISEQAERYADERVGDRTKNIVLEPGARINKQMPAVGVVGIIVLVILVIAQLIDLLI